MCIRGPRWRSRCPASISPKVEGSPYPGRQWEGFDTLNDAYKHGLKLIDKILLHVGYDDANEWKVIVLNDQDDAELVIPFTASYQSSSTRKPNTADQTAV
jgi:hypothetical protein